jgi:hypothetical protein
MVTLGTELVRGLFALAGVAVLATTASAGGGNITTNVDEVGDLWLYGDDLGNELRIRASGETTDEFRIQGLDGTTIDGQAQTIAFAPGQRIVLLLGGGDNVAQLGTDYGSAPSCCSRHLVVVAGAGDDELVFIGPFPFINVDLGAGNDRMSVGEGGSQMKGAMFLGDGDDEIVLGDYTTLIGDVDMGSGNDHILVGWEASVSADVDMGASDDEIEFVHAATLTGEVQLNTGDDRIHGDVGGASVLVMGGVGSDVIDLHQLAGNIVLRLGAPVFGSNRDDDVVTIHGLLGGSLVVEDDYGNDRVSVIGGPGSGLIDPIRVHLGRHDDAVVLQHLEVGSADLDGGTGFDTYLDVGTTFASPPTIVNFEARFAPGPDAIPPATVVGQVAFSSGQPVSGATVLLPRFGLVATTDDAGRFRFGTVPMRSGTLEITTGAIVAGRQRTGAGSVVLQPQGDSDAGEIVLGPGRRNVLVFGEAERTAALEGNLLLLGFQPAEVTRTRTVPPDLTPYGVALHAGGEPLAAEERARLADFVRSGGGLYLSGQSPALDTSLAAVVNELLGGATIQLRGGISSGPHTFNPQALDGLAQRPNALTAFDSAQFSRVVNGAQDANAFVRLQSGEVVGAAWSSTQLASGRGRLVLLTSASWVQPGESLDVLENLIAFLQRQPAVAPHR